MNGDLEDSQGACDHPVKVASWAGWELPAEELNSKKCGDEDREREKQKKSSDAGYWVGERLDKAAHLAPVPKDTQNLTFHLAHLTLSPWTLWEDEHSEELRAQVVVPLQILSKSP